MKIWHVVYVGFAVSSMMAMVFAWRLNHSAPLLRFDEVGPNAIALYKDGTPVLILGRELVFSSNGNNCWTWTYLAYRDGDLWFCDEDELQEPGDVEKARREFRERNGD